MEYKVVEDIKIVCKLININEAELANLIGIDKQTITRVVQGKTLLSQVYLENFYDFVSKRNIELNKIKEMSYRENCINDKKLLFHGSKTEIIGDLSVEKSKDSNDFGKGFYLGETLEQSINFIEGFANSNVYIIEFNPSNLKFKKFDVTNEWMLTVAFYRKKLTKYKENAVLKRIINEIESVDYIIAPIADNKMFKIIDDFINGELTDEQCKHSLASMNLGMQFVFKTQNSLKHLTLLEKIYVSESERRQSRINKERNSKLSDDKVSIAKIQYRGKGKYIGELL